MTHWRIFLRKRPIKSSASPGFTYTSSFQHFVFTFRSFFFVWVGRFLREDIIQVQVLFLQAFIGSKTHGRRAVLALLPGVPRAFVEGDLSIGVEPWVL